MKITIFNQKQPVREERFIFGRKLISVSSKKVSFLIAILMVLLLILEGFNIHLSNQLASSSIQVSRIQEKIESLEHKNLILESEILKFTSYEMISSHAALLGFVEPKDVISLYKPLNVAVSR